VNSVTKTLKKLLPIRVRSFVTSKSRKATSKPNEGNDGGYTWVGSIEEGNTDEWPRTSTWVGSKGKPTINTDNSVEGSEQSAQSPNEDK
jgi:hypothetical protein